MRCRGARRVLLAALDGEITAAEREALNAHLGACAACRADADETARLHRVLRALPQGTEVPSHLEQAALRRVRGVLVAEAEARDRFRTGRLWWWLGAPVAVTIALVVTWRSLPGGEPSQRTEIVAMQPATPMRGRVDEPTPARQDQHPSGPAVASDATRHEDGEPPPQVAKALDLYLDLPLLENLEKLENFDTIRTVDVSDGTAAEDGRG